MKEACPRHTSDDDLNIPLIRKKGKIYCVRCRVYCVRQEDFDESKHKQWDGSPLPTARCTESPGTDEDCMVSNQQESRYGADFGATSYSVPSSSSVRKDRQAGSGNRDGLQRQQQRRLDNSPHSIPELKRIMRRHAQCRGQLFYFMDQNRNGVVSLREFEQGLALASVYPREDDLVRLFRQMDTDRDGRISWKNFVDALSSPSPERVDLSDMALTPPPDILAAAVPIGAVRRVDTGRWEVYDEEEQYVGAYASEYEAQASYVEHSRRCGTRRPPKSTASRLDLLAYEDGVGEITGDRQKLDENAAAAAGALAVAAIAVNEEEEEDGNGDDEIDLYLSNILHEKLLLGWKTLAECCKNLDGTQSRVPLLEDRDGRVWSAVLDEYVDETSKPPPPPSTSPVSRSWMQSLKIPDGAIRQEGVRWVANFRTPDGESHYVGMFSSKAEALDAYIERSRLYAESEERRNTDLFRSRLPPPPPAAANVEDSELDLSKMTLGDLTEELRVARDALVRCASVEKSTDIARIITRIANTISERRFRTSEAPL